MGSAVDSGRLMSGWLVVPAKPRFWDMLWMKSPYWARRELVEHDAIEQLVVAAHGENNVRVGRSPRR